MKGLGAAFGHALQLPHLFGGIVSAFCFFNPAQDAQNYNEATPYLKIV